MAVRTANNINLRSMFASVKMCARLCEWLTLHTVLVWTMDLCIFDVWKLMWNFSRACIRSITYSLVWIQSPAMGWVCVDVFILACAPTIRHYFRFGQCSFEFSHWHEGTHEPWENCKCNIRFYSYRPLIHLLMPVFNWNAWTKNYENKLHAGLNMRAVVCVLTVNCLCIVDDFGW